MIEISQRARDIGDRVEHFVRTKIAPFEQDPRRDHHGAPTRELVREIRALAREAGLMTPHIMDDGSHLTQVETAYVLIKSGFSPLGPLALNLAGVKDWASRGFAMGTGAHGIGTARALQVNEVAGAFAGLAMGLNALATAILLPLAWALFR